MRIHFATFPAIAAVAIACSGPSTAEPATQELADEVEVGEVGPFAFGALRFRDTRNAVTKKIEAAGGQVEIGGVLFFFEPEFFGDQMWQLKLEGSPSILSSEPESIEAVFAVLEQAYGKPAMRSDWDGGGKKHKRLAEWSLSDRTVTLAREWDPGHTVRKEVHVIYSDTDTIRSYRLPVLRPDGLPFYARLASAWERATGKSRPYTTTKTIGAGPKIIVTTESTALAADREESIASRESERQRREAELLSAQVKREASMFPSAGEAEE